MYGKRRFARKSTARRSSGTLTGRRRLALRKVGRRFLAKPKFATVGYTRNMERKYFDKTFQSNSNETLCGNNTGDRSNGVTYISNQWSDYSFGGNNVPTVISNDMFKGLATGTTARSRIGNKLKVKYIKGAFTFTAALVAGDAVHAQNGESFVSSKSTQSNFQYLRTSYRMLIVKDLQVNSTDTQITWQQVMDTTNKQAGIHSELNVDNMGRFIVLEDKIFTVDADQPQKTVPFMLSGSSFGHVRYNGPEGVALTDKGCYVVWAAFVMGFSPVVGTVGVELPSPVGHSRLCFSDE